MLGLSALSLFYLLFSFSEHFFNFQLHQRTAVALLKQLAAMSEGEDPLTRLSKTRLAITRLFYRYYHIRDCCNTATFFTATLESWRLSIGATQLKSDEKSSPQKRSNTATLVTAMLESWRL